MTSDIPFYIIDGSDKENVKINDLGIPKTKSELENIMKNKKIK